MKRFTFLLAVLAVAFQTPSFAQKAPDVDQIIDNYFEAIGGKENWKELHSMRFSGNSVNMGMTFPTEVISMRPNLQKVTAEFQNMQYVEAYDGTTAWMLNPFSGATEATKKTEEETKEAAKNNFEDELLDYKSKGHQLSLEGTEEVDGTSTYKLKLTKADGDEVLYFFDTEAYVPLMIRTFAKTGPMEGQAVEIYFSDYDEVDGLMIAHSIEQKMNGQTIMQMTAEKIELNPEDIDASDFAYPKE